MKYYLIVNPYGGGGKGLKIQKKIQPIFESSGVSLEIINTTHSGHAKELAESLDFNDFDGICPIGGDGTMHEVINGMMTRKDNHKIPIGLITGGTGNSFMHDLDCLDPVLAAKKISQLQTRKIDLMKVTTNNKIIYSYNVAGWGMPPDINILAEKMRWLGPQRYNIASLIEIMKFKKRQSSLIINNKNISDDYSFILCCNTIHTGKGMKIAPKAKLDDGLIDIIAVKKTTRNKLFKLFPKIFSGSHITDSVVNYHQVNTLSIKPTIDSELIIDGEIIGSTPCTINLLPKEIDIFN